MSKSEQLDFLIGILQPSVTIPQSIEDKWRVFRSLVNVREPKPVADDFLQVQNELLQSLIAEKGITDIADLKPLKDNICLWRGDITTLRVDAIVNAANSAMLGCFVPCHACIDNAIHTFAGIQLRLECADIMKKQGYPEPTGAAKITAAYNLPCRHVIHTVGPIIQYQLTQGHCDALASCYRSCLEIAGEHGLESIAFCCISTGEFRFPKQKAAEIAVQTVREFQSHDTRVKRVIFNVFTDEDCLIYKNILSVKA